MYTGNCIGGPCDGIVRAAQKEGIKYVERGQDGKTTEHVYHWSDGAWRYIESWVEV